MVIFLLSIFSIKDNLVKAINFFADDKDVPVVIEIPVSDEEEGDDIDDEKVDAMSVVKSEDDKADIDNNVTSTDSTKPAGDQGVN